VQGLLRLTSANAVCRIDIDNQRCENPVEKASSFPIEFPPLRIRENHGRFDLPFWHRPITSEKKFLLLGANDSKAMLFVKADRPYRIRPGADQYRTCVSFRK
jgi:hypothetical protein